MRNRTYWKGSIGAFCLTAALALSLSACDSSSDRSASPEPPPMPEIPAEKLRPLLFVHGTAGSASQYQTQAQRFASNGYPLELIHAYEYSTDGLVAVGAAASGALSPSLDAFIDGLLEAHDADQVYIACHSLGTRVCTHYLGDPERAAKIAGYIGIDGQTAESCPGDVPCMGVFVNPAGQVGDVNTHLPDEAHVQVATSAASFLGQFEFLTGVEALRTEILPSGETARISGRAVYFPANSGAEGTTLEIWPVNPDTGHRQGDAPLETADIGADGHWGPFDLDPQAHYEFRLVRPERSDHHFYRPPFVRDNHFVRMNTSRAGSAIEQNTHAGPDHASLVVSREMEWWTSKETGNDVLEIATTSPQWGDQAAVNGLEQMTANTNIGLHFHDAEGTPAVSTLELLEYFDAQVFQSGADVYMPATTPPDGTITLSLTPRGNEDAIQVIRVPNWASEAHRISVMFDDYSQD
jgi:pimeloyl-ACP methyl ester carboxylesterase